MFEDVYPSADASVSGIVTLLAAASALGKVKSTIDPGTAKPVMFAFLNGVSADSVVSVLFHPCYIDSRLQVAKINVQL